MSLIRANILKLTFERGGTARRKRTRTFTGDIRYGMNRDQLVVETPGSDTQVFDYWDLADVQATTTHPTAV